MFTASRRTFLRIMGASIAAWPLRGAASGQNALEEFDYATFKESPLAFRGTTMWGYDLSTVTDATLTAGVDAQARKGYGGFLIGNEGGNGNNLDPAYKEQAKPFFHFTNGGEEFLSDEFFRHYRLAIEEGKKNNLPLTTFYDDYEYPTGTAAGQVYMKYPQHMAKRLDMTEREVIGPAKIMLEFPDGIYVGSVLMNTSTYERIEVSGQPTADHWIPCTVPEGNWKAMVFYLNVDAIMKIRNPGLVDYLDEEAMDVYLDLVRGAFYSHLKEYFGSIIKMSFFDEPTMHWLDGRTWTPTFNARFEKQFGYSPMKHYPALWYDIGPETAAARNALFGFRGHLFATTFVGKIRQWCRDHGILSTGHLDQEEAPNPTPINGDLMKVFEHQDIPGHDDILYLGRANHGYKVVTSAAYNYDKPVVMAETYAAYEKIDEPMLFRVAMDQFAMGISFQIPAADSMERVKDPTAFNAYIGRLSYLLRGGRHVADVGVLYPIASLHACYRFSCDPISEGPKKLTSVGGLGEILGPCWEYAYYGGVVPPEIDYMKIGEILYRGFRLDYTYLHPEVLEKRCSVAGDKLKLNNQENQEEYRVLIVPGGKVISIGAANRINEFYQQGGTVICTSRIPYLSSEFGRGKEVQQVFAGIYGISAETLVSGDIKVATDPGYLVAHNPANGKAFFLPQADPTLLETVLKLVLPVRDVKFAEPMWPLKDGRAYEGALTYLHKVKNGQDIYFFANSSEKAIDTTVVLRGKKQVQIWNPHTGEKTLSHANFGSEGGSAVTTVQLALAPASSLFLVEEGSAGR
jgi:hypothetical protein